MTKDKRPIDHLRESALSFDLGDQGGAGGISGFVKIGEERMLIVASAGIFEMKLADQIDPQRTNPGVPNTQHRVLHYGSNSLFVARTLLTAHKLFPPFHYPDHDVKRVIELALSVATNFAAMQDAVVDLRAAQDAAVEKINSAPSGARNISVPQIENLEPRVKNFIQCADHAYQALFDTTEIFFGVAYRKRWFETFATFVQEKFGIDEPFVQFINGALPTLRFLRFARDCVEHPKATERLIVRNFELEIDGKVVVPTLEVLHPQTPQPRTQLLPFLEEVIEVLSTIYEVMLAHLANLHVKAFAGMDLAVSEFPPVQLGETHVRFSLSVLGRDGPIRFG